MPYTAFHSPAPGRHWLDFRGPDVADFLHRLSTVHVRALAPGHGAEGFFLTAQGKVRARFTLWRLAESHFAFEFDAGREKHWHQELLSTIEQFTFAENMTLTEPAADWSTLWLFDETPGSSGNGEPMSVSARGDVWICRHGTLDFDRPWISLWGPKNQLQDVAQELAPGANPLPPETLDRWRILALRPQMDVDMDASTIPLEVGLKDGIAEMKGCYPGQEVIERIVALGAPARRLALLHGSGPAPTRGSKVLTADPSHSEIGAVTSAVATEDGSGYLALALIKKLHAKEGLEVHLAPNQPGQIARLSRYE